MISVDKINIRADHPSVNHGTSENWSVKVPSVAISADNKVNPVIGNSVVNHCCCSLVVKFPLINSLMVSISKFLLAGKIRYTGRIDAIFICFAGDNF